MRLLLLMLVACGGPVLAKPNTVTACGRAIECGVFVDEQEPACAECLEHVNEYYLSFASHLPPLEKIDCEELAAFVAGDGKALVTCTEEDWYK